MNLLIRRRAAVAAASTVLFAVIGVGVGCSSPAKPPPKEESVKPGINKRFLSEELDLKWAVDTFEGESREVFVSRQEIVEAAQIRPGAVVADIGAGTGLFLELFSKAVGAEGKVWAVDIAPKFVEHMTQRIRDSGWERVEARLGGERSAGLEEASIDVAFLCDTYHHFEYPVSMSRSLHSALRPGGWLIVVDFERIPGVSSDWILGHVRADKETVVAEITSAGFSLVDEPKLEGLKENYYLRFRRS